METGEIMVGQYGKQLFTVDARELMARALNEKGPTLALLVCGRGFLDQETTMPVSDGEALSRLVGAGIDPLFVLDKAEAEKRAAEKANQATDADRVEALSKIIKHMVLSFPSVMILPDAVEAAEKMCLLPSNAARGVVSAETKAELQQALAGFE